MRRNRRFEQLVGRGILLTIAALYAYGAMIHVVNMSGLAGIEWSSTPLRWRLFDVVYLILDVVVVVGFVLRLTVGYVAFYIAAVSQILLYGIFGDWMLGGMDVPVISPEQMSNVTTLIVFHLVTLLLVSIVLCVTLRKPFARTPSGNGDANDR